ncbi:hypothetical protein BKA70DRAFT_755113 [Coprinopsis sp. MPI-PUGE-AT-0042]|nr:hypothetical protein BKA70DRAFT_755113 [Coprinopsis sp. MPI-PUGE-AT-0042]
MTIPPSDYHRSQTWGTGMWRDVQVVSLPLGLPFPNLTKLCLKFAANIRGVQKLYQMLAFKHLTALQFSGSSYDNTDIVLQDLLSQLPMLKHLDIQGVEPDTSGLPFTHYRLKSLTTRNGPYHRYSGLSLPSLQRLSVGHAQYSSDVALSSLSALLSNTPNQLRMLGLDTDPLNEMDIYHLLTDLPMLEELVLRVPFNGKWETMEGHTFRKLLEHSSDSVRMLLPRLKEVILHMDRKVEEDDRDPAYRRAEFAGFCAFRDAFIDFVEDPRRGLAENEMDIAQEADNLSALIEEDPSRLAPVPAWAGPLEIAHFDYAESDDYYAGVVYHRGRDYTEPVSFWDDEFV